ncbi:hypothetical protein ASD04_00730 [Devosia sp. Root436]|nr:hypothetical protein ASD04_00730 [Devosia sp. Root436]
MLYKEETKMTLTFNRRSALALGLCLVATGAFAQEAPPAPANPVSVQIGGAGVGQFGYFTATGWANAVAHVPGYQATPVATSGFVENAQLLAQGSIEFGWVAGRTFDQTALGDDKILTQDELPKFRALFSLPAGANHIVVPQTSSIHQLSDLAGKKISGFGRGSGGWDYVTDVLGAVGIDPNGYSQEPLGPSEAMQALKEGTVDAVWATGNAPAPVIAEFGATTPFRLIPIPADVLSDISASLPSWQSATVPQDIYSNMEATEGDLPTVQQTMIAATTADMDEETAYAMTYAVMENIAEFGAVHPGAKLLSLETALNGISIPLHPGAVKYFQAKGVEIPENLLPPAGN